MPIVALLGGFLLGVLVGRRSRDVRSVVGADPCGSNPLSGSGYQTREQRHAYVNWLLCRWNSGDGSIIKGLQRTALHVSDDGVITPQTRAALANLQARWGLPATGIMDFATMDTLSLG